MQADLLVLDKDLPEIQLVAEVKVTPFDRSLAEHQLTRYMVASSCPLGLLITPDKTWMLRDTYEGSKDESIRVVGEYLTADLLGLDTAPESERELIDLVHTWLEKLASSGNAKFAGPTARRDVSHCVLPAIIEGRVFTEAKQ